jgi:uncharacterized protein
MARAFLDTNFLLMPGRLKVDVFTEIASALPIKAEFVVLEETVRELVHITNNPLASRADRQAARLGIVLAKQQHLKMVKGSGNCDQLLLNRAKKGDYVATQDKELKEQLREKGIHVLTLRQKRYVIIEN